MPASSIAHARFADRVALADEYGPTGRVTDARADHREIADIVSRRMRESKRMESDPQTLRRGI